MQDGPTLAIIRALQYLIRLTPVPKEPKKKTERDVILQGLVNAGRPSRALPAEPGAVERPGRQVRQPAAATPAAESDPQPTVIKHEPLSVLITEPDNVNVPIVRPGTTAGIPFTGVMDDDPEMQKT